MGPKSSERRRFPRSKTSLPVHPDASGGILNHVENISANGVLCQTAKPLALMTRMQITLDLPQPGNRAITADGVVVRCDPEDGDPPAYQVAILFTKISDEDHEAVRRFVEYDLSQA